MNIYDISKEANVSYSNGFTSFKQQCKGKIKKNQGSSHGGN